MASGKSTVAEALAQQFPQSVHLRGDSWRLMLTQCHTGKRTAANRAIGTARSSTHLIRFCTRKPHR
ncbi:MAG: hypothetical protein ABI305_06280 [Tepidiformaceae bacterium]